MEEVSLSLQNTGHEMSSAEMAIVHDCDWHGTGRALADERDVHCGTEVVGCKHIREADSGFLVDSSDGDSEHH